MEKKRLAYVVCGIVANVTFAGCMVYFSTTYPRWEALKLSPERRVFYYQHLLHILCYEVLPLCAVVFAFSAVLFWTLRKRA
jgi:hypothetical protein